MTRNLALSAAAATFLLSACATMSDEGANLAGTAWTVEDISGRGVIDGAPATLAFGQDGRLSGDTSCNRYFADYRVDGTKLAIGSAGVTRRACAPAIMDQERRFLELLKAVGSYRIDASRALILSAPNGATITARAGTVTN
jgi:putative lipoprotein